MRAVCGYLLFLLIFGTLIHLGLNLPWLATHPDVLNFDAYEYFDAGKMLYGQNAEPHPTRLWGFPLVTGWITLFSPEFESFFWLTYCFNAACWLGTGTLLWYLGPSLFLQPGWLSRLPAVLFGLNVGGLVLVSQPLTESFYSFLLVLAVWCWQRSRQKISDRWLLAAWAVLVYAIWVRPTAFIWLGILGLFLLRKFWQRGSSYPVVKSAILGTCVIITLGWQVFAMHHTYGQWKLSNIGALTYHFYTDAYACIWEKGLSWQERAEAWGQERDRRKEALGLEPDNRRGILNITDWPGLIDTLEGRNLQTWRSRPGAIPASLARNLLSNALGGSMNAEFLAARAESSAVRRRAKAVFWLSRVQNAFYSGVAVTVLIIAIWRSLRRRHHPDNLFFGLLAAFSLTVFIFSAISFAQGDRFNQSVAPLSMLCLIYFLRRSHAV